MSDTVGVYLGPFKRLVACVVTLSLLVSQQGFFVSEAWARVTAYETAPGRTIGPMLAGQMSLGGGLDRNLGDLLEGFRFSGDFSAVSPDGSSPAAGNGEAPLSPWNADRALPRALAEEAAPGAASAGEKAGPSAAAAVYGDPVQTATLEAPGASAEPGESSPAEAQAPQGPRRPTIYNLLAHTWKTLRWDGEKHGNGSAETLPADAAGPDPARSRAGRNDIQEGSTLVQDDAATEPPAASARPARDPRDLNTSFFGQAFWAALFGAAAGVVFWSLGADQGWLLQALRGAGGLALAVVSLGYAGLAAEFGRSIWRHQGEQADVPNFFKRLWRSVMTPIANQSSEHPALEGVSEEARHITREHEAFHRRWPRLRWILGDTIAYLKQIPYFPGYLWTRFRGSTAGQMILGDPALKHLIRGDVRSRMALVTGLFVLDALLSAGAPYLLGLWVKTIDEASKQGLERYFSELGFFTVAIPIVLIVLGFVQWGRTFFSYVTGFLGTAHFRVAAFGKALRQNPAFYNQNKVGGLVDVAGSAEKVAVKEISIRQALLYHPVFLLIGFVFLFSVGAIFGWTTLAVLLPVSILIGILGSRVWVVSGQKADLRRDVTATTQETLDAISLVKALGVEEAQVLRNARPMKAMADSQEEEDLLKAKMTFLKSLGANFALHFLTVCSAFVLALSWIQGFDIGQALQVGLFAGFISGAFSEITEQFLNHKISHAAGQKAEELALLPSAIEDRPGAVDLAAEARGKLDIQGVSFAHSADKPLIQDVSIHLEPGEVAAILGESGAGKSTLVSLVMGHHAPQKGAILLDGRDMRDYTRKSLGDRVAYVPQDVWLQKGTLRWNLTYRLGRDVTDAEIFEVLKSVKADQFVLDLRDGLDTVIQDDGKDFSGGQGQRLALARALLKQPILLVLDEPTSALDKQTEQEVTEALENLMAGNGRKPTILLVTHSASLAKKADRVFVLKNGVIAEQGAPGELLVAGEGEFAKLYQQQEEPSAVKPPAPPKAQTPVPHEPARGKHWSRKPLDWARSLLGMGRTLLLGDTTAAEHLKPLWGWKALGYSLLALEAACALALPKILGFTLDEAKGIFDAGGGRVTDRMGWLSAGALLLLVLAPVLNFLRLMLFAKMKKSLMLPLMITLFEKFLKWKVTEVNREQPGVLASQLLSGPEPIAKKNLEIVPAIALSALIVVVAAILMLSTHLPLALFVIAMGLLIGRISKSFSSEGGAAAAALQNKEDQFRQYVFRLLTWIRNIRMFRSEEVEDGRLAQKADEVAESGKNVSAARARNTVLGGAGTELGIKYALYIVGGWLLVLGAGITLGQLVSLVLLAELFKKHIEGLTKGLADLKLAEGQSTKYVAWYHKEDPPDGAQALPDLDEHAPGRSIELENVYYTHPATEERGASEVFRGVSLRLEPGERVAVVGPSMHGKSTLLGLILGWLSPNSGKILIDGKDVAELSLKNRQKNIVYVSQKQQFFKNETLEYNLRLGAPDATEEQLWEAIRAAGAEKFVTEKTLKYQGTLSGGQAQRVALIQAFLKLIKSKARILLLDEPTASLDSDTAAVVQKSLRLYGATMLIVTHDVESTLDLPRVLVVENGGIVQEGAPAELLMDPAGRFWQLLQAGRQAGRQGAQ